GGGGSLSAGNPPPPRGHEFRSATTDVAGPPEDAYVFLGGLPVDSGFVIGVFSDLQVFLCKHSMRIENLIAVELGLSQRFIRSELLQVRDCLRHIRAGYCEQELSPPHVVSQASSNFDHATRRKGSYGISPAHVSGDNTVGPDLVGFAPDSGPRQGESLWIHDRDYVAVRH